MTKQEKQIARLERAVLTQGRQITQLIELMGASSLQDWDAQNARDMKHGGVIVNVTVNK